VNGSGPPGGYGPRPGFDDERTPVAPHPRPSPVVVRSGDAPKGPPPLPPRASPRAQTPKGGTLAPLGPRIEPDPFPDEEAPTPSSAAPHLVNKHLRVYLALQPEDRQLVHALALRLLSAPGGR